MKTLRSIGRTLRLIPWLTVLLVLPIAAACSQVVFADQGPIHTATVSMQLYVGDSLIVHSDRLSIQQAFVEGNLSAADLAKQTQYPTNDFEINASAAGSYVLQVVFNQSTDYTVNLFVRDGGSNSVSNSTAYYISGGSFELDVSAFFNPRPVDTILAVPSQSPWDSFVGWMGSFSQAFPLWVKALYFFLAVQFLTVGGLWIRRETSRKEGTSQRLDSGDKAYLWLDVVYKFLLVSFVAIVAIMGGELILLFVLRFMFLVSLDLLSLWDLFVVGFAAGAVIFAYVIRFTLERAFDLKPVEGE